MVRLRIVSGCCACGYWYVLCGGVGGWECVGVVVDWKEVSVFASCFRVWGVCELYSSTSCAVDTLTMNLILTYIFRALLYRIMPVISLGDTCSQISAAKSNLLVLTVGGQLYAW